MNEFQLNEIFRFHPANTTTQYKHEEIRLDCLIHAHKLNEMLPESREKSLAITRLEEVMFWANAAIAIHTEADECESPSNTTKQDTLFTAAPAE